MKTSVKVLLWLMGVWMLTACCHHLVVTEPTSLDALVQTSDFSQGWDWLDSHTQTELEGSADDYLVESSLRSLTGYYGPERHYIRIMHLLKRYGRPVSCEAIGLSQDADSSMGQEFVIHTAPLGNCVKSRCTRETQETSSPALVCKVVVGYEYVTSGLTVYAPGCLDNRDIETVINEALAGIDARIGEIDNLAE